MRVLFTALFFACFNIINIQAQFPSPESLSLHECDSLTWTLYGTGNYLQAEVYAKQAVELSKNEHDSRCLVGLLLKNSITHVHPYFHYISVPIYPILNTNWCTQVFHPDVVHVRPAKNSKVGLL